MQVLLWQGDQHRKIKNVVPFNQFICAWKTQKEWHRKFLSRFWGESVCRSDFKYIMTIMSKTKKLFFCICNFISDMMWVSGLCIECVWQMICIFHIVKKLQYNCCSLLSTIRLERLATPHWANLYLMSISNQSHECTFPYWCVINQPQKELTKKWHQCPSIVSTLLQKATMLVENI